MRGRDDDHRPPSVYWALLVGLTTFSLSPILVRLAGEAPGLTIAVWRTLIAAGVLMPFALVRARGEMRALGRRDLLLIAAAGILLGLHFVGWIESLYHTTVASASVLVTTSPIFLALLGYALLGERISKPVGASIGLAVVGASLIGLGDLTASPGGPVGGAPLLGNALALGASLVFSLYLLVGRVVRQKTSWLAYVFPLYVVAGMTALVIALLLETPLLGFRPGFYVLCAVMALGPQLLGHGSFNYAVRYVAAAMLGLLSLVEPVGASVLAYLLFGERPGVLAAIGMVVVLVAISFAILQGRRTPAPAPVTD